MPGLRWAAGEGGLRRCQAGAGRGGPGIQGHDGLRQPARPPNWQVSGWRRPALSRSKACSAKLAVRKSPFEFPIPLIDATPGVTAQLAQAYARHGASVLAVENVPLADTSKYGIVAAQPMGSDGEERVTAIVEKPRPEEAPSTLAVVGRYMLRPKIFDELARTERGRGGGSLPTPSRAGWLAARR